MTRRQPIDAPPRFLDKYNLPFVDRGLRGRTLIETLRKDDRDRHDKLLRTLMRRIERVQRMGGLPEKRERLDSILAFVQTSEDSITQVSTLLPPRPIRC